jgi:transcriptional regulator with XRE-family HTH domain
MKSQGITGQEVASRIGITPPNLSQIINGHAKPRQGTFSNLCKVLGNDKRDEKLLVDAFVRIKEGASETDPVDPEAYQKAEIERAERFLEIKAQSIAFKRSVARELDKARISYRQDYCEGIYVTDFLIEHNGKRSALECKFNVQRDLSKAITIAGLLKEGLNCDTVYIVVPYLGELEAPNQGKDDLFTVNPSELISKLSQ